MIETIHAQEIATITLKRTDRANALNTQMLKTLLTAVQDARDAKAIILTGAGRVFSAGADLDEIKAGNLATSSLWEDLSAAIADFRGFSIAALNGTVAGGAMGMVLACDLRFSVSSAKFFYPVMRLGVLPQPSDPVRMRALIGPARAKMILIAGQKITADQAQNWGLVDLICEDPLAQAQTILADIHGADMNHIHKIKSMVP